MIYVCNFYAHGREGVSNQIELLRKHTNGCLFSAGIFLNQKFLSYEDVSQKRIILSESEFNRSLPGFIKSLPPSENIHYFSEEPESNKLKIFNSVTNRLFVSMYRRPTKKYAVFLKKFKNLSRIYVELNLHKEILINFGINPEKIIVSNCSSILKRSFTGGSFTQKFLFASWNGGDIKSLRERGLINILDFLENNPESTCNVILRDNETSLYKKIIKKRCLDKRITLSYVNSISDLRSAFANTNIVFFLMQKKLTKDVPNSIIDGFSLGKPVLMTNVIDFSQNVAKCNTGWVIKAGDTLDIEAIKKTYEEKSKNAFDFSKKMTASNYIKSIISGY